VGEELGVGLGLLRTGELMSARSVDGAQQFFTRAYDFGFSKSIEETNRFWQPDSLLKDVVRVIRRFRPHVLVSVFTGTPRDGHGQHMAAGAVTRAAFQVAGEPSLFPELAFEEGLEPWTPLKLYQSAWFDRASTTLELPVGGIEPRSGRTYQQIAMASRSLHRSQDMGRAQSIVPVSTRLHLVEDRTGFAGPNGEDDDLFLGIPAEAGWLALLADSLRDKISATRIADATEPLVRANARGGAGALNDEERRMLAEATAISAGLLIDAYASTPEIVRGESVEVLVRFYNGGPFDMTVQGVEIHAAEGWEAHLVDEGTNQLPAGTLGEQRFIVTAGPEVGPTQPYYLERPLTGALYDWSQTPAAIRAMPVQPPELRASLEIEILGATLVLDREVTFRRNDQAVGEVRLPVRVVPEIDVRLEPERIVWPADDPKPRDFTVSLVHNGRNRVSGLIGLESDGLEVTDAIPFIFSERGESRVLRFRVTRPSGGQYGRVSVRAVASTNDGREFDRGVVTVAYPHIRPSAMVVDAQSDVRIGPIEMPRARRVGYVRGAADRMPEALLQVGLPLELLTADHLARADLSHFDAVVVGSRAYETDTALVNHNDRLLEYVERGGHLVVLYQQYQFAAGGFAPYQIEISRPHDRITDETAPVMLLQPDHAVFNHPNRISSHDWEGWPQERGLYFAGTWDEAYTPLLEMADPGDEPTRGGLLVTRYGNGTYVYTGLSFFRAIPAGVVGAYRLFLNLLALGGWGI